MFFPVFMVAWNAYDNMPEPVLSQEAWDMLDDVQRLELCEAIEKALKDLDEFIVPDFVPDDLLD